MDDFGVITTFFNPSGYQTLTNNYKIFSKNIPNLTTFEVSFDGKFHLDNSIKIYSPHTMWLKEKLINYAFTLFNTVAWLDCDLILPNNWQELTKHYLKSNDIIQLFRRVFYLPKGHESYQNKHVYGFQGIVHQRKCYNNWLDLRINNELPFASPGFAWAAKRTAFPNGIYDKDIIGSGDCILADALFDSWQLHGYEQKYNESMKKDINKWKNSLSKVKIDCLPIDIFHLWHGDLKDRHYLSRHKALADFDPDTDLFDDGIIYKWSSDKVKMHEDVKNYFFMRKEDI